MYVCFRNTITLLAFPMSLTQLTLIVIAGDMAEIMKVEMIDQNAWHTTSDFNPESHASLGKRIKVSLRRVVPKSIL